MAAEGSRTLDKDIASRALVSFGEEPLIPADYAQDAESLKYRIIKLHYLMALTGVPWTFCKKRKNLAQEYSIAVKTLANLRAGDSVIQWMFDYGPPYASGSSTVQYRSSDGTAFHINVVSQYRVQYQDGSGINRWIYQQSSSIFTPYADDYVNFYKGTGSSEIICEFNKEKSITVSGIGDFDTSDNEGWWALRIFAEGNKGADGAYQYELSYGCAQLLDAENASNQAPAHIRGEAGRREVVARPDILRNAERMGAGIR
ncbi:hypothetical protein [Treponema endosymbiont of Eucomonympha sp.]|uniref:hypothetical protein n=1 Tax=Treponema endosymbiont of Eucomonympha sp. TaxID=1580831 RepID=UPI0007513C9B|nr:hypothetical protein [Treponema endosymbiont of Eucomonympha sp.]